MVWFRIMTLLFTFETVSSALDCEGILKKSGCSCRVIPAPRSLSASCVYAISLETHSPGDTGGIAGDPGAFCRDLRARGGGFARVFRRTETGGKETYEEFLTVPGPLPARGNSGTG
ncbi:MAG: DUF3343 domain-containing protein [Spirochaetaceae bacterium]|nr:DUF3343 domain-containing protein [Spirochaetaceae bacterium]